MPPYSPMITISLSFKVHTIGLNLAQNLVVGTFIAYQGLIALILLAKALLNFSIEFVSLPYLPRKLPQKTYKVAPSAQLA